MANDTTKTATGPRSRYVFSPLNEISEKEGELNDEEAFITNMAEG